MGRRKTLQISATKSSITLFTSDTHQSHHHPAVTITGTPLLLERHPKLLGVTFDQHFTFHNYARVLKEQTAERLKVLRALPVTDWSRQKETIILTYKALIWSKTYYAASIWFPNLSKDADQSLQVIQNPAK